MASGRLRGQGELMLKKVILFSMLGSVLLGQSSTPFRPDIPKVWDDNQMRNVELPLAAHIPVHHMPSDYYYRIPVRPNLKTYPIYVPGKEPKGYWEWLQQQEPAPAFNIASLKTQEDWIKAGELV